MLTNINIANALGTISAAVDGSFRTENNLILANGIIAGTAILNTGGETPTAIDGFAAEGTAALDTANNRVYVADGSYFTFAQGNIGVMLRSIGDTSGKISLNEAGLNFTPDIGDGVLGLAVAKGDSTLNLALNGTGTITLGGFNEFGNLRNAVITIPKDFSLDFAAIAYTDTPISGKIYGDGTNDITARIINSSQILLTNSGFVGANLNLGGYELNNVTLGGTVILDPLNQGIIFAQGATIGLDIGTRRINFETTDTAGGQLTLGANGLTFTTAGGDGGLVMSVTENGETRSSLLGVAGSITYALDGTISLAQGTVIQNVFEDGNVLTITAKTDASGTIVLQDDGLVIAPATPDALTVALTNDGSPVAAFSSITGTINYNNGVVTASDGSKAHLRVYDIWESELYTTGGTASVAYKADRTIYTANEGATFLLDYLDGTTVEIQHGIYSDIYETETEDAIELISAGADFRSNDDEFVFTLEKAGNYTLNGKNVTTTADGVQVLLLNYDTVIPLEEFANNIAISADLAYDFLPNYAEEYKTALALTDAISFDALSEILPAENLGEINFGTQTDELTQEIVIAPEK